MTSFTIQSTVADLLDHQTTKIQEAEQELSLCSASIEEYKTKAVSLEAELRTQVDTFLKVFGPTLVHSIKTKLTDLYMDELTLLERMLLPFISRNKDVATPNPFYWVLDVRGSYNLSYVQSLSVSNLTTLNRTHLDDATKDLIRACESVDMECHIPQLEVVVQYKNSFNIQQTLNKKKELNERICSLNNVIKILNNLPLTQTVTYQVTYDGSCSIK
jgi:hypothetical protein